MRSGSAPDATLRRVTAEDRFVPYGQSPTHAVPVLRWLAKRQVPRWLRARQLVVAGASGIAWVCGHRVDAGHAVLPTTTRVAILEVSCPSSLPPSRS